MSVASVVITPPAAADPSKPAEGSPTATGGIAVSTDVTAPQPKAEDQRPKWLPEKFKTPEDMATAYAELEKKQGQTPPAAEKAVESAGFDMTALTQEFNENGGKLSDETIAKLEEKGITRAVVDSYVAGIEATQNARAAALAASVGGEDKLTAILEWAVTGLSAEEIQAYNAAVDSQNDVQAKMLLQTIAQKHTAATGSEPKLVKAEGVPQSSGIQPYTSIDEVHLDMRKAEYKNNEAFRQKVAKRLEVSNL